MLAILSLIQVAPHPRVSLVSGAWLLSSFAPIFRLKSRTIYTGRLNDSVSLVFPKPDDWGRSQLPESARDTAMAMATAATIYVYTAAIDQGNSSTTNSTNGRGGGNDHS